MRELSGTGSVEVADVRLFAGGRVVEGPCDGSRSSGNIRG